LKYRKGLRFVILLRYETALLGSSRFPLTVPTEFLGAGETGKRWDEPLRMMKLEGLAPAKVWVDIVTLIVDTLGV
jgi:hypothetical protein